jgi:hypothetical protein
MATRPSNLIVMCGIPGFFFVMIYRVKLGCTDRHRPA